MPTQLDDQTNNINEGLIYSNGWNGAGVRNRYLNFGYRFATANRNTILVLFFLIFGLFLSQNSFAGANSEPVFELSSKSRGYLTYTMKIFSDGKLHFHGYFTEIKGERYAQITPTQLDELVIAFLSMPFEALKQGEYERKKDTFGASRRTIAYKDEYIVMDIEDSIFFLILEKKIDKLVNLKQWICKQNEQHQYEKSCLRYDLPDDIQSYLPKAVRRNNQRALRRI